MLIACDVLQINEILWEPLFFLHKHEVKFSSIKLVCLDVETSN